MFTPHIRPARSHLRNMTMPRNDLTRRLCTRIPPAPQVENPHQRGAPAVHDFHFFVPLVKRTTGHFGNTDAAADKAYSIHRNPKTVERFGRTPHIPFNTSTDSAKGDLIWAKMYYIFMCNRKLFSERYHKRSNVESVFSMVDSRFGDLVRFKSDGGRPNEALAKVLCQNSWAPVTTAHDPGIEPTVRAGSGDGPKLSSWKAFGAKSPIRP